MSFVKFSESFCDSGIPERMITPFSETIPARGDFQKPLNSFSPFGLTIRFSAQKQIDAVRQNNAVRIFFMMKSIFPFVESFILIQN